MNQTERCGASPEAAVRRVEPTKSLLQGGSYTPAERTDVRVTWRRAVVAQQMLKDYVDPWSDDDLA